MMVMLSAQIDAWNRLYPVGQDVRLKTDGGEVILTKTRSPAQILGGHSAVIWLVGVTGCYALDRVSALPVVTAQSPL